MSWECVHDNAYERVRRIRVPGGWLYQVERLDVEEPNQTDKPTVYVAGWSTPVFVPRTGDAYLDGGTW